MKKIFGHKYQKNKDKSIHNVQGQIATGKNK